MNTAAQRLYTQKDLVTITGMPRQTLERYLPDDGYFLMRSENNIQVKSYPLDILPENIKPTVIAYELAVNPEPAPANESPLALPATVTLKKWQRQVLNARLALLHMVNEAGETLGSILKAEAFIAQQSQSGQLDDYMRQLVTAATVKTRSAGVSANTLRTWRTAYLKYGEEALAPIAGKNTDTPPWMGTFLQIYRTPGRPSIKQTYEKLEADGVQLPSLRTVERWVKKLGKVEANKGRLSSVDLKQYRKHSIRGFETLRPLDIFVADGQTAKFYVQHPATGKPFKPEIVSVIDIATRVCVGWSVGFSESFLVTSQAIGNAVQKFGVPAIFYSDRGSGYKNEAMSNELSGLMERLGVTQDHSLPRHPQSNGVAERFQGTCWRRAARLLPAYAGSDCDKYHLKNVVATIEKDIKTQGTSPLLMTWEQFMEWCQKVVDDYNNRPHSSLPKTMDMALNKLRHQTPAERFASMATKQDLVKPPKGVIEDMLRPYEIRQAHNGWVTLWNNKYYHAQLESYHGQKVMVGYDFRDPENVWVRTLEEQLICIAKFNGNKHDYFAKSKIEQAADKRAANRKKRLEMHLADVELERKNQAVIELTPEKEAQILEFQQDWEKRQAEPKLYVPEDDYEKYEMWLDLAARADDLTKPEQDFFEQYPKSPSFAQGKKRAQDIEKFMTRY